MDKSRLFLMLTGASAAMTAAGSCANNEQAREGAKSLNVVYIMCDDHAYQAISAYDKRYMRTPNIDRLAEEGARFTNSFVANSISGPSRACMLTGKHSHVNGFTNNEHGIFDGSQQTLPKLLQAGGYQTAMVGKWHLVSDPTGFDYWDILTGQGDYYNPVFIRNGNRIIREGYSTDITTDVALDWLEDQRDPNKPFCLFLHYKAPHRSWMPDAQDLGAYDDVTFPLPDNFYDNYSGREAAGLQEMSIIKDMNIIYDLKMADKEGEIHTPENPSLEQYGRGLYRQDLPEGELVPGRMNYAQQQAWDAYYDPIIKEFKEANLTGDKLSEWKFQRYMRDYCSVINSVDRNVGRVYEYLKEHDMLDNTVIIYTSDQGFYMGEHGYFDKRFMYEESFRTPLLVRMPGGKQLKAAKPRTKVLGANFENKPNDIAEFVQNIDYAPTILDIAGLNIPSDIQGESFLPLLNGEKPSKVQTTEGKGWRTSLYYHYYEYPAEHAVRRHYGVRTERYSLMHFYNDIDEWELFDLQEDPEQMHNIYGKAGTEKVTETLLAELHRLQKLYQDPIEEVLAKEK
ncbi:MAG: sulfatase [Bacteroidales bacterium]|nr:sulfatase [Bacteroidales bacterium]MDY6000885.1 sulfatase [Candidatus Cryptobacteroides sp.]